MSLRCEWTGSSISHWHFLIWLILLLDRISAGAFRKVDVGFGLDIDEGSSSGSRRRRRIFGRLDLDFDLTVGSS
jgi:hypothetical protein